MSLVYRDGADGDTAPIDLDADQTARWHRLLGGRLASLHDHPVRLPEPLTVENWQAHAAIGEDVLAVTELKASDLHLVYASCLSEPRLPAVLKWGRSLAEQVRRAGFHLAVENEAGGL